jgi:Mce-associated membrane protein
MARDRRAATVALLLAAALLAVGAGWLFSDGGDRRDAVRGGTIAAEAARESIVAISTYQPSTVEETLGAAARDRLTGKFLDDYTQLVKTVLAPESLTKKISAATTVPAVAVVSAEPRHAVVLAYVDQTRTAGAGAPEKTTSTVRVTMDNVDGRWLISDFEPI